MIGLSPRPFWKLPHAKDIAKVDGHPVMLTDHQGADRPMKRWELAYSVASALIASTSPAGRHAMLRNGFVSFQIPALGVFRAMSSYTLNALDLRCIYEAIEAYVKRNEAHMQVGLARQWERRHAIERVNSASESQLHEPQEDDTPIVERVEDGFLKRVDPREVLQKSSRRTVH